MSRNTAMAIAFATSVVVSNAIIAAIGFLLDANGSVLALTTIVLIAIGSLSLGYIDSRPSPDDRR